MKIQSIWRGIQAIVLLLCLCSTLPAWSANQPCSGRKGGVAHCQGELFVCNDGSISGSRKICSSAAAAPARALTQSLTRNSPAANVASSDCSCRSGGMCTGPRGGRYCISDSGRKSYLRP